MVVPGGVAFFYEQGTPVVFRVGGLALAAVEDFTRGNISDLAPLCW